MKHFPEPVMESKTTAQNPGILVWMDLNAAEIDEIRECKDKQQLQEKLAVFLGIYNFATDLHRGIEMDLYYHGVVYALNQNFSNEQLSAYVSILKRTHEKAIETAFNNVDDAFDCFKEMVSCHSVKRPPFSAEIFHHMEARRLTNNIVNTYFKHYKLYKYAFTPEIRMELKIDYSGEPDTPDLPEESAAEPGSMQEEVDTALSATDSSTLLSSEPTEEKDTSIDHPMAVEGEDPGMAELKSIIRSTLDTEVGKIKVTMDQQLKNNDDEMTKKLLAITTEDATIIGNRSPKVKKTKNK